MVILKYFKSFSDCIAFIMCLQWALTYEHSTSQLSGSRCKYSSIAFQALEDVTLTMVNDGSLNTFFFNNPFGRCCIKFDKWKVEKKNCRILLTQLIMWPLKGFSPYLTSIMLADTNFRDLGKLPYGVVSHRAFAAIKEPRLAILLHNLAKTLFFYGSHLRTADSSTVFLWGAPHMSQHPFTAVLN